ncbi:hypothetical protein AGLY_000144 [Aphis glycines]|uniref:Uncharacterized protein n=1 Tax=Aphis glycines TaxID=307491 RepID=A0A6G0U8J2_APHGL|nr:hypothetical protein AGLY_000144 [Aphis glycines]
MRNFYIDRANKILSTLQKKFSEKLKISVLKKTQNILKIKSCKENANLNNCIYDLYFLNNNKYQKSFEAKPLFNAVLKIYGEPCTKFSKLSYKRKKFYDFSTSKLLANFRVFDRFPTIKTTHKEPCIKFSKLFGHPTIFYRHFKKNFSKKSKISVILLTLTFGDNFNDYYNHKKNRFSRKLVFRKNCRFSYEIGALFRLVMLYTDTKKNKKKKKTHIIIKSIHSSLRSESKNVVTLSNRPRLTSEGMCIESTMNQLLFSTYLHEM